MSSGSSTSYHSSTLPNRKGKVSVDGDKGKKVDIMCNIVYFLIVLCSTSTMIYTVLVLGTKSRQH